MLKYGLTAGVVASVSRGPADRVHCRVTGTTASVVISETMPWWPLKPCRTSTRLRSQGTHQYCAKTPTSAAQGTLAPTPLWSASFVDAKLGCWISPSA